MSNRTELANLIFPEINKTINDLEGLYPERDLKMGAIVTRFAPSPTGFLHTGSLFTALIASKIALDSEGIFYIRLEDTDTKREIKGSDELLIRQLEEFNININEGYLGVKEEGSYGPYRQSLRKEIYEVVIKEMLINDLAYPCFLTEEELTKLREEQTLNKEITGVYGSYAIYKNLDPLTAIEYIKAGKPYVIRFKSSGDHANKIKVKDEIRGELELTQNDQDIVILKSDGLPTYHFAHVVDDHFMHTTLVTRGEEWLPSLPIHLDLFDALNFKRVKYAHLPVIMKLDDGHRRKLSKRKDSEASVDYFLERGYEPSSLLVYLMTIANSNYEDYLVRDKNYDLKTFKFNLKKMSLDGALFDLDKLNFYAKEILAKMNKEEIASKALTYASLYDKDFESFINNDYSRFIEIINIDREKKNPRKDYAKYSDIYEVIKFFDLNIYKEMLEKLTLNFKEGLSKDLIINFLEDYKNSFNLEGDESTWFNNIKSIAARHNFASDSKTYKENPGAYNGNINDACEIIRIAITLRNITPNLYEILKIIGNEEIKLRLDLIISKLA